MKTGVIIFAADDEHCGPMGLGSKNRSLPGLHVDRMMINPRASVHEVTRGSKLVTIHAGRGIATWTKPGELEATRIKVVDAELILLPANTRFEMQNIDDHEPLIYTTAEAQ